MVPDDGNFLEFIENFLEHGDTVLVGISTMFRVSVINVITTQVTRQLEPAKHFL